MKYFCLFLPILLVQPVFAQSKLPVIHATSKQVSISDGGYLDKNAWNLSPKTRPDIYTADRTRETKWVVFYTDIDSIKVKVKPGSKFDFIVVLNGKDSCYTQIASAIPPPTAARSHIITHDTIPFTLSANNAIGVKAVIDDTDTINMYFDLSSFDLRLTKDALLKTTNKPGKLQMGSLVWGHPVLRNAGITSQGMDGRFGWNLFDGKTVEIDYDNNRLVIRSGLPGRLKGYTSSKLEFIRSYVCIKAGFQIDHKTYNGDFILDNGSNEAVILDSAWTARQHFPSELKLIKTLMLRDPRGAEYETKIVLFPQLNIHDVALTNVPTLIMGSKNPADVEINFLGNDVLKRFNMVLDFEKDYIYLKPNKLMGLSYRENS